MNINRELLSVDPYDNINIKDKAQLFISSKTTNCHPYSLNEENLLLVLE